MQLKRRLTVYIALTVVLLYVDGYAEVGGMIVRPFDLALLAGLAVATGVVMVKGKFEKIKGNAAFGIFLLLSAYTFVNAVFLSSVGTAIKDLIQSAEFILLILLIAALTREPERRTLFIKSVAVGFALLAMGTALWHVAQGSPFYYKMLNAPKASFAFFAFFASGFYLDQTRTSKLITGAFIVALLLLLLSAERKGWVAFAIAFAVMVFVQRNVGAAVYNRVMERVGGMGKARIAFAAVCMVGLTAFLATKVSYIGHQLGSLVDVAYSISSLGADFSEATTGSNRARLYLLFFTVQMLAAHPILGVGTGRFKEVIEQVAPGEGGFVLGAHSEFQRLAVENGFPGLILYVLIWVFMYREGVKQVRSAQAHQYAFALMAVGLVALGAVTNMFLGGGALNIMFVALPMGLLLGLKNERKPVPA